jgi:putative acetyltransferase
VRRVEGTSSEHRPAEVEIRTMAPDELPVVRAVAVAAFGDDEHLGELVDALAASWVWDESLSFVAERDGRIVGQVLYTHARLDAPRRLVDVLVLSPVGVVPDLQGRGIGSSLIERSLEVVAERDEPLVLLEGNPAYYERFGFVPGRSLQLRRPSLRIPDIAFQAFRLPAHEPWMTGTFVYPDVWWAVDAVGLR